MADTDHVTKCENMEAVGKTVAEIAKVLSTLDDAASARRVLVATGLISGVYDVSPAWKIIKRAPPPAQVTATTTD